MFKCGKCQREFTREQNLTMHEKWCNGKKGEEKNGKEEKSKEKPAKKEKMLKAEKAKVNKGCEHDFKALTRNIQSQDRAILAGYNAVCIKCGELM
jgi:hypothetical protein